MRMSDAEDADSLHLDTLHSESLPSVPEDIGKWFESYEYESPVLDSADGILDEFEHESSFQVKEPDDLTKWFESYVYESPVLDSADGVLSEFEELERSTLNDNKSDPKEKVCAPRSLATEVSGHRNCSITHQSAYKCENINTASVDNESKSFEEKDEYQDQDPLPKVPEATPFSVANGDSCNRDDFVRSIGKENQEVEPSETGFISIRKEKHGNIRATVRSKSGGDQVKHRSHRENKGSSISRKPLSDASNLNMPPIPTITGDGGKWYCPKKRKPNLGPPLKQLQLEHWLHPRGL